MKKTLATSCAVLVILSIIPVLGGEIHNAVKEGDYVEVKRLLDADASLVNAELSAGVTPLHVASALDLDRIAALLIERGASKDAPTSNGSTPLHWAAMKNSRKTASLLIGAGASITARMDNGMIPLRVGESKGAAAVVALLRTAHGEKESEVLSDARFQRAQREFADGKQEEAFYSFSQLLRKYPDSEELNGAVGMSGIAVKNYPHAAAAFERILAMNPDHERARFELGRAYLMQERFDLAKKELEAVLDKTSDESIRKAANEYLGGIKSSSGTLQFQATVNVGVLYDDNVNVGPGTDVISIAPLTLDTIVIDELAVGEDSLPVSDWGFLASASGSILYDVGARGGLGLTAAGSYYQTWLSDASEYDTLYYGGGVGLKYASGRHLVELPLRIRHIDRGSESLVDTYGAAPIWLIALDKKYVWHWVTSATIESRDYSELDDRDGPYIQVTGTIRRFIGAQRHSVAVAASYINESAESDIYSNDGFGCSVVGEIRLPWRITAYAAARYKSLGYKNKTSLETENRSDNQLQFAVGASRASRRGYGINVGVHYTDNNSTFGLYDYTRLMTTATASLSF